MKKIACSMLLAAVLGISAAHAQDEPKTLVLDLPLADAPYNFDNGGRFPSMYQSLAITRDTYAVSHGIFGLAYESHPIASLLASGVNDMFLLAFLPGADAWVHEEGHRAVMGQYGIESYNEIYKMQIMSETVSVSHVKDEDLAWLKARHPADMVRLHSAGIEMEYEWIDSSREEFFFSGRSTRFERVGWVYSMLNSVFYIQACTTTDADKDTDKFNAKEATIKERDFTGMDFTAWVYDLHRPNEPYAARGTHPLGNGYDRYIRYSDLTSKEKRYLKQQYYLSFMNFVSPQFIGFDSFLAETAEGPLLWNGALAHYLTSFGSSSEAHIWAIFGEYNISGALRLYRNEHLNLPGLEAKLYRLRIAGLPVLFSGGLSLWLQPKNQMFHSCASRPGAAADIEASYPFGEHLEAYTAFHAKSAGWQAGEVSLAASADVRAGMKMRL